MKTLLLAAAGLGALAIATPAFADGNNTGTDTTVITINASTPAKCDLNAGQTSVNLGAFDITNDEGRARNNIGQKVAQALNGADIRGWCTGGANNFIVSRSSLNTGDGQQGTDGFNRAVIYDVEAAIENATRNSGGPVDEGTSDGSTLGPVISRFGPTGAGEKVTFIAEPENSTSSAVSNGSTAENARGTYTENNARLVAGDYTGTVTVSVTPGV